MRYSKRLLLVLLCSMFVLSLFLGFPIPTPVTHADNIPPLQWPQVSLGNLAATNLITTPSGGVVVGCGNTATNAFTTFSSTGSNTSLVNSSSFDVEPCTKQATVDANGVLYTMAYDSSGTPLLAAYAGTTLRWTYTLPCSGNLRSLVVGTNGKIYMTLGSGSGCGSSKLVGIESNLASGQTTPTTDFSDTLYTGPLVTGGNLAAYSNGLVVRFTNGLSFFDYSGNEATTEPGSLNLAANYGRDFSVTMSGRTFVPIKASPSCGADPAIVNSIDAYDPGSTTPAWSFTALPVCAYVYELHATPTGGVAAYIGAQSGNDDHIIMLDSSGYETWSMPLPTSDSGGSYNAYSMATDLHGDVAVENEVVPSGSTLPAIGFILFSENAGYPIAHFLLAGDSNTYGYESTAQANLEMSIAKDTVYVSAHKCPTPTNCNGDISLFAIKVSGLEADYLRGPVLGVQPATNLLRYVALGDSFSSGEGVEPFDPASNTSSDQCHRSDNAYSNLLSQEADLSFQLTAFTACSGATTNNVKNGQNGEPAQILAIDQSTNIVTITIGGNDIGFKAFLIACINPAGSCTGDILTTTLGKIQNDLPTELDTTYAAIKARIGPHARVLVVGYPREVPYDDSTFPTCGILSTDERVAAREVQDALNQAIYDAVSRAGTPFEFVDADANLDGVRTSPFAGHEFCSDNTYFNGVDAINNEYSMHPNEAGQAAYAELIKQYLASTQGA